MFFLIYTLFPVIISAVFVFLILRHHMEIKLLLLTSAISYGIVFLLTAPEVTSWYFANLPFPLIYMSTIVLYGSMLYSLSALVLVFFSLIKKFSRSRKSTA